MDDAHASAERDRFYATLGQMTASNVEAAQSIEDAVARLTEKMEELHGVIEQSVECMVGFHQFLDFVANTYEEGEEPRMRDDLVSILKAFGEISQIFRQKKG